MNKILTKVLLLLLTFFTVSIHAMDDNRVYNIAYIDNFYPYQQTGEDGPEGFVIDLLKSISKREGITFNYFPMNLNEAINALKVGNIDGIAGLKYTGNLNESFDFSEPFTTVSHSLTIKAKDKSIESLADLGGKVVAIVRGDEGLNILYDIRGVQVIVADNQVDAMRLLEIGRADAFLGNTTFTKAYLNRTNLTDEFIQVSTLISPNDFAFAARDDNKKLLNAVNHGLIKVRADQEYQGIYNKWFGWENNETAQRLTIIIAILGIALLLIFIYAFFTSKWNKHLQLEVRNRTIDLEKTNRLLRDKMEEEKNLRDKLIYKEKMQTLGQLVAGIAHEIRNPLTSIKAFVELIPRKYQNERFREEIATYLPTEINRLNQLVNNLLDYAKPQIPKKENFLLQECFDSVLPLFNVRFKNKNISITNKLNQEHMVYADYSQVKQVIINLLLNAADAIEKDGEISLYSEEKGNFILAFIEDTGKGIAPENLKLIFEPFYTDKKEGTGLGLSLSLQYMKENEGDLIIKNRKGIGTTAIIILPKGEQKS